MLVLEEPSPSLDEKQISKQVSSKLCHGAMAGPTVGTGEERVVARKGTAVQVTCEGRHISHRHIYILSLLKTFHSFLSHVVYISEALLLPIETG